MEKAEEGLIPIDVLKPKTGKIKTGSLNPEGCGTQIP